MESLEAQAREMLKRAGCACADAMTSGDLVEIANLLNGQVWQDIALAPKGHTTVWVLLGWFDFGSSMMRVGFWHPRENAWCDTHHVLHNQHSFPTHWMPLPAPPTTAETPTEDR
jgi:hypothetical protein